MFLPALLASVVAEAGSTSKQRARLHELINRLGVRPERVARPLSEVVRDWIVHTPDMAPGGFATSTVLSNMAYALGIHRPFPPVPGHVYVPMTPEMLDWETAGFTPESLRWFLDKFRLREHLDRQFPLPGGPQPMGAFHRHSREILDWLVATATDPTDLDFGTALARSRQWHATFRPERRVHAVGEYLFKKEWPDGWRLLELLDETALRMEGEALEHCVGVAGYADRVKRGQIGIFSLRGPDGQPRVTIEMTVDRRSVSMIPTQVRARRNHLPITTHNTETLRALKHLQPDTMRWGHDALILLPQEELDQILDEASQEGSLEEVEERIFPAKSERLWLAAKIPLVFQAEGLLAPGILPAERYAVVRQELEDPEGWWLVGAIGLSIGWNPRHEETTTWIPSLEIGLDVASEWSPRSSDVHAHADPDALHEIEEAMRKKAPDPFFTNIPIGPRGEDLGRVLERLETIVFEASGRDSILVADPLETQLLRLSMHEDYLYDVFRTVRSAIEETFKVEFRT
jgi:hypothetical protein